jgi:hypothetical protein
MPRLNLFVLALGGGGGALDRVEMESLWRYVSDRIEQVNWLGEQK